MNHGKRKSYMKITNEATSAVIPLCQSFLFWISRIRLKILNYCTGFHHSLLQSAIGKTQEWEIKNKMKYLGQRPPEPDAAS